MTSDKARFRFGTAGVPHSTAGKASIADGVRRCAELGLGHMEIEWVHGVRTPLRIAEEVRRVSEETGVSVSCHAPYYLNLASLDESIRASSVERLIKAARVLAVCGGDGVVFHPAFIQNRPRSTVGAQVEEALSRVLEALERDDIHVALRPETTGKPSQYGSLDEVIALSRRLPDVAPCVDFSHLHARDGGGHNDSEWFGEVLDRLSSELGTGSLSAMHVHLSGISFTPAGERRHYNVEEEENSFNWRDCLRVLKRKGALGVIVCESPNLEEDTRLLANAYARLR